MKINAKCRSAALYGATAVVGVAVFVLGACLGVILHAFLRAELTKLRVVDEAHLRDASFTAPDAQTINVHVFNLTNADAMQRSGALPEVSEHVISLLKSETRYDARMTRGGEGYEFTSFVKYEPADERSSAMLDETFVQVNPAYVSAPSAVKNPANEALSEDVVLALMSPLIVAQVRDLFANTLPLILKTLSVPAYLGGVRSILGASGMDEDAILAQWAALATLNATLFDADPAGNALLRSFEAAPALLGQGLSLLDGEGRPTAHLMTLWDAGSALSLTSNDGAALWLAFLVDAMEADSPADAAVFASGTAGSVLAGEYGPALTLAVAGYLQALMADPSYEAFLFAGMGPQLAGLSAPGAGDVETFAELSYAQFSGEVAMQLMTQGTARSVVQLGLDDRVICAPEIATFLDGRHGLASSLTPSNAETFLAAFSDPALSGAFLTDLASARASGRVDGIFNYTSDAGADQIPAFAGTGITMANVLAVGDYLYSYLPQDFFVKGYLIGFRRRSGARSLVGLPEEYLENAGGTGHVNGGLFTRRTGAELLHGWDDPLFDHVPQALAAVELKWRGALGTDFGTIQDQRDAESASYSLHELRSGRSQPDRAGEILRWKGVADLALQSDLPQPAMAIECPTPGNNDCTIWEAPEDIEGALSGSMIPPFSYDFCSEARSGGCGRRPLPSVDVWFGQLLRRLPFRFDAAEDVKGLFTYRYVPDEAALLQPNSNYHVEEAAVFPMARALVGAPLYGSLPYLAFAPEELRAGVRWPEEQSALELARAASAFLNVEPYSGLAVKGRKAYQFNWLLSRDRLSAALWDGLFQERREHLVPYMWIEESATIDTDLAGDFANALYTPQEILPWAQAFLLICGTAMVGGVAYFVLRRTKRGKVVHASAAAAAEDDAKGKNNAAESEKKPADVENATPAPPAVPAAATAATAVPAAATVGTVVAVTTASAQTGA